MTEYDVEVKENLKEMRMLNEKNNILLQSLQGINVKCYGIKENIEYEKEKLENLNNEIKYRKQKMLEVKKQLDSIQPNPEDENKGNQDSKKYILELKNDMIKKNLESIFEEKLPEMTRLLNNENEDFSLTEHMKRNEFYNLIFDHVIIFFDSSTLSKDFKENNAKNKAKEEKQNFKISKKTSFRKLKSIACKFWNLENENDFLLCDESEALIYNEETSVDYYLRNYSVLVNKFKLINLNVCKTREKLLDIQDQKIRSENKFNKNKNSSVSYQASQKEPSEVIIPKIRSFLNEYPGLKSYMINNANEKELNPNIKNSNEEKNLNDKQILNDVETSFPMMLIFFLLYILTLVFLYHSRSISTNYSNNQGLKDIFDNKDITDQIELFRYLIKVGMIHYFPIDENFTSFKEINYSLFKPFNISFPEYVSNDVKNEEEVSCQDNKQIDILSFKNRINNLRNEKSFIILDNINMIVSKVKSFNCSIYQNIKELLNPLVDECFNVFYDPNTAQTSNEKVGLWNIKEMEYVNNEKYKSFVKYYGFRNPHVMNVTIYQDTATGRFEGSGFYLQFLAEKATTNDEFFFYMLFIYDYFIIEEEDIKKNFFFGQDVRNIMLYFTLFDTETKVLTFCVISFDFFATGIMIPNPPIFKNFQLNIYSKKFILIIDSVRLFAVTFLLILIIIEFFNKYFQEKSIMKVIIPGFLINLMIIGIFYYSFLVKLIDLAEDIGYVLKNIDDIDFGRLAHQSENIYAIESIMFGLISIKILKFLKLNKNLCFIFSTLEISIFTFLKYSIFFIIFMFGYAIIFYILYGPYLMEFSNLKSSFIQILIFSLGYIDIQKLLTFNTNWSVFFMCVFYIYLLFFMYTVFNCIYIECLRRYIVKNGFPEDYEEKQWTLSDFSKWCTNFMSKSKKDDIKKS